MPSFTLIMLRFIT